VTPRKTYLTVMLTTLLNVILQRRYAVCHYTECHYVCRYSKCSYSQCICNESHYIGFRYSECYYAEPEQYYVINT
jgi:hypothetical protein